MVVATQTLVPSVELVNVEETEFPSARSLKRPRIDVDEDEDGSIHETLTPRLASRCPTPSLLHDVEFFDDKCHDDFEWVRLPKKRDYDLFQVAQRHPEDRDGAEVPLIAKRHTDGADVTMWAYMDTGADANFINLSTLRQLLGDATDASIRALTMGRKHFALAGDKDFEAQQYVLIDFRAGRSDKHFEKIRFLIIPDDWQDPNGDGVPNVILGWPHLREHSMVMIDLDYHLKADPERDVVAPRAEDETADSSIICIRKFTQTKGAPPKK